MITRAGSGKIPPDQHAKFLADLVRKRRTHAEVVADKQRAAEEKAASGEAKRSSAEKIAEFEAAALEKEMAGLETAPAMGFPPDNSKLELPLNEGEYLAHARCALSDDRYPRYIGC